MSLHPQSIPAIPEETMRVARAVLPKGNAYMHMRDHLGALYHDHDFVDLFPPQGQAAYHPWRLALISIMQYAEDLTDRQAAEAVRVRIDWKYALSLEITNSGFAFSLLSEFRSRLLAQGAERRLFDLLPDQLRDRRWIKKRDRQRTDSTHVLAAIRTMNRLECVGETMRHALNVLAAVVSGWLEEHMQSEWGDRYRTRFTDFRLPKAANERVALAKQIGRDGRAILEMVYASADLPWLPDIPALQIVRQVWMQQYHASRDGTPWRQDQEMPPAARIITSPYDVEARYSRKRNTNWTGYKVHVTETCETDLPHLVVEVITTGATKTDGETVEAIHYELAAHDLLPGRHLVDSGYVYTKTLIQSYERYQVDLFGPVVRGPVEGKRLDHDQFLIDWKNQQVHCPVGCHRERGDVSHDRHGKETIEVRFSCQDCQPCPLHDQCTRSRARVLLLRPNEQAYQALRQARQRQQTPAFRKIYAKRAGVEGTIAQGVRTGEIRLARYIGRKKLALQALFTATALNLLRACEWIAEPTHAHAPVSCFARFVAALSPAEGA